MKRFFTLFIVALLAAFTLVYLPPVREYAIGPFTQGITQLSGWLIQLFGGTASVNENVLSIPGFRVRVVDMCNGVEATILLLAAMVAFPAPLLYKLKGMLIGIATVHTLNILRIISLVYLGAYKPEWFDWVHWYLWDALIMLDILVVFLAWIRLMPTGENQEPPGAAAVA